MGTMGHWETALVWAYCNEGYRDNWYGICVSICHLIWIMLIDVDECASSSPCHPNATCTNLVGSFDCACNSGFSGDGRNDCNGKHGKILMS